MAFDEFLASHVGTARGFLGRSLLRWRDAANAARQPGFVVADLFTALREQFVDNWNTWNGVMAGPETIPTITITAGGAGLIGRSGATIVRQRLTGFAFLRTPLEDFAGGNTIPANYALAVQGNFDGELLVTMAANAPVAGTYRGMVLGRIPPAVDWHPVAWVVAIA